jgi:hypothetical protein
MTIADTLATLNTIVSLLGVATEKLSKNEKLAMSDLTPIHHAINQVLASLGGFQLENMKLVEEIRAAKEQIRNLEIQNAELMDTATRQSMEVTKVQRAVLTYLSSIQGSIAMDILIDRLSRPKNARFEIQRLVDFGFLSRSNLDLIKTTAQGRQYIETHDLQNDSLDED